MAPVKARPLVAAGCLGLLALGACAQKEQDQMSWARAALERNNRIEVVATDQSSRTFTVRIKDTGELRMVRADQVVAGPAAPATTAAGGQMPAAAPPVAPASVQAPAAAAQGAAAEPVEQPPAPPPAGQAEPGEPAQPAAPAQPQRFASAASHAGAAARPVAGQVLEAGPGYTIEAGAAAVVPVSSVASRDPPFNSAPLERRNEPIVCQGAQLLHIDNRNLQFDGDAVSAEDGCEIHITNSRIVATGVGVSARAANVHIDNSLIVGDAASIDASDGAQIYTTSSRFRGLSRRLDTAAVHDLGGNVWN
jgi:hypothetical protein